MNNLCNSESQSCKLIVQDPEHNINKELIKMVNNFYYDLQMFSNYVFGIDNDQTPLDKHNNIVTKILNVQKKYWSNNKSYELFTDKKLTELQKLITKILNKNTIPIINPKDYDVGITNLEIFGSGMASSTILLKFNKNNIPIILKVVPIDMVHLYDTINLFNEESKKSFIENFIVAPSCAIYIKEMWAYCFTKIYLQPIIPTFNCIKECELINGFPFDLNLIKKANNEFITQRKNEGKPIPYKKWFNFLVDDTSKYQQKLLNQLYGVYELKQVEGVLEDLLPKKLLTFSLIFEYLLTKVVASHIGRIIFTDDHFGNLGYITVNYGRHYKIKQNNHIYDIYLNDGLMLQMIDMERYVFCYNLNGLYTVEQLEKTKPSNIPDNTLNMINIINSTNDNIYIFDKSLKYLKENTTVNHFFTNDNDNKIVNKMLNNNFLGVNSAFYTLIAYNIPDNYKVPKSNITYKTYDIDLDDNLSKIIHIYDIWSDMAE